MDPTTSLPVRGPRTGKTWFRQATWGSIQEGSKVQGYVLNRDSIPPSLTEVPFLLTVSTYSPETEGQAERLGF